MKDHAMTAIDVTRGLRSMGITEGDTVLVRISLRALGEKWVTPVGSDNGFL